MKNLSMFGLSLILAGSLASSAWATDSPGSAESKALDDPTIGAPAPSDPMAPDAGAGSPAMGSQQETTQKLIEAMRDLAQTVKDQTKEPSAKAKIDQVLSNLETLRSQNRSSGSPSPGSGMPGAGSSPGSGM